MKKLLLAALGGVALFSQSASAATLIVNGGGILTGATDVVIGTGKYDVEFVDGTCAGLFNGCNDASDFTFTTAQEGIAAANALLDQVLIGEFDTATDKIFGCSNNVVCVTIIPYAIDSVSPPRFTSAWANNYSSLPDQAQGGVVLNVSQNFMNAPSQNLAKFTYVGSAVPEASSWAMMVLGLGAIGGALRSRRQGALAAA